MAKPVALHEVIAIEKGVKSRVYSKLSEDHKALQKKELFVGHVKTFRPKDEDPTSPTGEQLPEDRHHVQLRVLDIIRGTIEGNTEWLDIAALRDWGNTLASADVLVDGEILIPACPVTFLLVLDKVLSDLHTFVKKLPTLDSSEKWRFDGNQDLYATEPSETARTKKIARVLVLAPATDKHPAQAKEVTEDVFAGTWSTIKYSSALPASVVNEMLKRVETLQKAVKSARERANAQTIEHSKSAGEALLGFIFEPAFRKSALSPRGAV